MLSENQVAEDKEHGGKRPGAGRRPKKDLNDFGRWIEASGKTKEEVAEALGVSTTYIWQLSHDDAEPGLRMAVKIEELTQGVIDCKFWVKSGT